MTPTSPRTPWTLVPFAPADAETVLRWLRSPEELAWWTGADAPFPPDVSLLRAAHGERGVHAYVLRDGDEACGYGEVWEDPEEHEAELRRIVVAPSRRGAGVGRALTRGLADASRSLGYADVWLRVRRENGAAVACYRGAGFARAAADVEARCNQGQPHAYVWMRAADEPA